MNTSTVRRFPLLLLAAACLVSFTTPVVKSDFSGTWKLNQGKSELGNFSRFAAHTIKVEQKEDAVTVSKTSSSPNNDDMTTNETLTFDGKASETTVFGGSKKKSTAKWSDDGNNLVVTYNIAFERNGQTFDINGTETWTLSADGKTLLLQTVSTSPQGERTTKAVYDKE